MEGGKLGLTGCDGYWGEEEGDGMISGHESVMPVMKEGDALRSEKGVQAA